MTEETLEKIRDKLENLRADKPKNFNIYNTSTGSSHTPLTEEQKQIYAFHQANPNSTAYNMAFAIEIEGLLDKNQLQKVLVRLVEWHELISSQIIVKDGEPFFTRCPSNSIIFEEETLASLSKPPSIANWIYPFNFEKGPLIHVKLLQLKEDSHLLFIDIPHLIGDGASLSLFTEDLIALYEGGSLTKQSSFHDYVLWRQEFSNTPSYKKQKKYWENALEGGKTPLQFPIMEKPPEHTKSKGKLHQFFLDVDQTKRLRLACRNFKVTPYMFLMACYHVFLSKICGSSDVMVGTSIEGRTLPHYKRIFGLLINSVPILGKPSDMKTFTQFLEEIKITSAEAFENQYFSFSELEEPSYSSSHFETLFDFHRVLDGGFSCKNMKMRIVPPEVRESKFTLSLEGFDRGKDIHFHFEYEERLFSTKQIDSFTKQFIHLLDQCIDNPKIRLCELDISLQPPQETQQEFSHIDDLASNELFLNAFKQQVKTSPDRIAISEQSSQLSYQSLDVLSSHLSKALFLNGVREGDCIAFYLDRGIEFLIAMLGVFKAGAYYVPLDLNAPLERRISLLEQCQPKLLIGLEDTEWCPFISYSVKELLAQPVKPLSPPIQIDPEALAYVIFTSGTTGKPKGAMVEHRGMMNHLLAKIEDFQFDESEIIAQTSSQTFDVSVWQFLTSLVVGGRVCVLDDDDAWTPGPLLDELEKNRITVFETVPSHMHLVLEEMRNEGRNFSKELKFLILNGEPLLPSLCNECFKEHPNLNIANAYGPTECSDDVCHHFLKAKAPKNRRSVPIGLPIRNTPIMIMNDWLELLTEGLMGELCVGGLGVGRGYLNNPEKTAEVFVPNPFGTQSSWSHRIYRTGDLAFRDFEGIYEHFGRKDHQIKLNGQRIELGEIEAVISSISEVSQCVVTVINHNNVKQLGAYLLLKEDISLRKICESLKKSLPHYMIPSQMMKVTSFSYLPSGKLDRKKLPPFEINIQDTKLTPSRTNTEKELSKIWEGLFSSSKIGLESHFFEMGGHSLTATQMAGRILRIFSVRISIRAIYQYPKLMDLAQHIEELCGQKSKDHSAQLPEVLPDPDKIDLPFPLTQVQQAYWLGRQGIFTLGDVSVHVYSEYDCESLKLTNLEKAWNAMIQRHGALRIVINEEGNQQILSEVPYYKFDLTDCTGFSDEEAEKVLDRMRLRYSHEVFPSDQWPLFSIRVAILPTKIRLFLSFDALIMDGWSVDLLFGEWMQVYRNPEIELPKLELSFRDCVLGIEQLRNHSLYQSDVKYWKDRVTHFPSAPMLPIEKKPDQISEQVFARCSKRLLKGDWSKIQQSIQKLLLSPTGLLCFIFSEVLSLFTGENHFALNLTLFDRPPLHPDIDHVVGDFTTLTLLEVKRNPSLNFEKRARALQDQLWEDLDHRHYGGIEFIRELSSARSEKGENTSFPVVLTSVLGLDDQQNIDLVQQFGKEVFSITQTPQVWLDFKAYEVGGELVVEWDFVKELFRPDFVETMHAVFCAELEALSSTASVWLNRKHCSLPKSQLKQRDEYNRTEKEFDLKPLHEQVIGRKDSPAVIHNDKILTYNDLMQGSCMLANQLLEFGVTKGDLVGIAMEKSWNQPIAALGILQAGAAYLPIDVHLPDKRIDQLIKISGAKHVVTQPEFLSKIERIPSVKILDRDHIFIIEEEPSFHSSPNLPKAENEDPAYVIFTSGSTGAPKGVVMQHGPVANTICDLIEKYNVSSNDRILGLSNLNFDLSVFDIFGIFSSGATLVLPSQARLRDASHWVELINDHKITIWNSVPMFMQMLVEFLENDPSTRIKLNQPKLRLILLSGDWIPIDLPARIKKHFPNAQIVSLGGATEAAIWSIHFEVDPSLKFEKSVPYGYPLANQQFYVLNKELEMVPNRVPGMLYIGGAGLAKEYFKDAEKTGTSFIHHPKLGRLYSTGDVGAYHPETGIEFLGRKDNQVKIRGHRIELGELEHTIKQHPLVEACTALVVGKNKHSQSLVSCIVTVEDVLPVQVSEKVISDPNLRIEFQLGQLGLEIPSVDEKTIHLSSTEKSVKTKWRKSIRQFKDKKLTKTAFESWLSILKPPPNLPKKPRFLDRSSLFELFSKIAIQKDLSPIPKYPYPSAGNLYPVQAHFCGGQGLDLPASHYVFNPKGGFLIERESLSSEKKACIKLIGKKEAIEPLYGEFSNLFCTIEAGYMFSLIHQGLVEQELGYTIKLDHYPEINFEERKTELVLPQELEILLYIKEGKVEGYEGGWYQFDLDTGKIMKQPGSELHFHPDNEDSFAIFQSASGGIFFLHHGEHKRECAFWSGFFGQKLMDQGCELLIGSCPLARIDGISLERIRSTSVAQPVHYLLFGPVQEEEFSSLVPSEVEIDSFEKMVQKYVEEALPHYMVPRKVEQISSIPLTTNGKVDKKTLADHFSSFDIEKREQVKPRTPIEKNLHSIWCDVLNLENIGVEDSFFELGGNSLYITKMALKVKSTFGVEIPLAEFFKATKISSLAKLLEKNTHTVPKNEDSSLEKDIQLSPDIQFPRRKNHPDQAVLLTGASGFLGIHLLKELSQFSSSPIYCLVRAKNKENALQRLKDQADLFQLTPHIDFERVIPLKGDLKAPRLGCDRNVWEKLEREIGTIVHNGSFVHHVYDYDTLREANVKSTLELIQLCSQNPKRLVYISSLLAMVDRDKNGKLIEDFPSGDPSQLYGGYQKTKWASEMLLKEAKNRGLDVMVVRPNTISGQTTNGRSSYQNDHFFRLVKGCIQMGYAPIWDEIIDLQPVEKVSKIIAKSCLDPQLDLSIINLQSKKTFYWTDLIKWLKKKGFSIQLIDPIEWQSIHLPQIKIDNALYPLLSLYLAQGDSEHLKMEAENFKSTKYLATRKLTLPNVSEEYLNKIFSFLIKEGFL